MFDTDNSGAISAHAGIRSLTPTKRAIFDKLIEHELDSILTYASGSPSQRMLALVDAFDALITSESNTACATVLDGLELHDFAVCAVRPIADCGAVFPREGDDALRRVVVVDPRTEDDAEPKLHLCCSTECSETLLRSWRAA